jgi:hypothetical protein
VDPAELTAAVAAADRHLAPLDPVADLDLDPRSDGVAVPAGLLQPQPEPVSHRLRTGRVAGADVAPHARVGEAVGLDEIKHAVEVQVHERGTAALVEVHDAGRLGALLEGPVRLADE